MGVYKASATAQHVLCIFLAGLGSLGNGDIGINAWVEPNNDLLLYLGKTDAWSENGRLFKVGRLRLHCSPVSA